MESELIKLKLLNAHDVKKQDSKNPLYRQYFMHGTSHHLGLDVHDVGNFKTPIQEGMVFTCEPGIYILEEELGIRLENDIEITKEGPNDLMKNIPIELEEAVMTIEKGLPFGLGIRAGKFRPDLGKINQIHAHLFPYIEAPSGMTKILGEEFWSATGVETNVFLPLPWYSNFSLSYFDSGIGSHDHSNHEKDEDHDKEKNEDHDKDLSLIHI